ncbi:hypothetical protein GCM10018980_36050 [Streptomyces capoamus]|uniref:Uncharacterized protein n=1 Tax=Streptomyces capoamus TaxID=68183 RepID=A0A919EWP3_9ACTN|nr:hypothetical protein GCM10018980_36050 [Streptomyces capoamus]
MVRPRPAGPVPGAGRRGEPGAGAARAVRRGRLPAGTARVRRRARRGRRGGAGARHHPHAALPVGHRPHARSGSSGRSDPQRRLAYPQQASGGHPYRPLRDPHAVERGAVRRAEVGDGDPAVRVDGDRAVQPGDVGVVQRDVGVGGAADGDPAAVQQVHPARVRSGDHVQLGRGLVQLGVRLGGGRRAQGEHGAVRQRRLAEGAAPGVEPLGAGVQHHGGAAGLPAGAALTGDRPGQRRRDRGQLRARGRRDQYVAAHGAAPLRGRTERVYDGQPDLHPHPNTSTSASTSTGRHPRTCH